MGSEPRTYDEMLLACYHSRDTFEVTAAEHLVLIAKAPLYLWGHMVEHGNPTFMGRKLVVRYE